MKNVSDEQLIAAYGAGDAGAMDRLLDRYQDRVFQFVLWRTGTSRIEAEDLAQEVFLQIFRAAGSFTGRSRFRTWLYSVASHVCYRSVRSRSRRRRYEVTEDYEGVTETVLLLPDDRLGALDILQKNEREQAVRRAVMQLESRQRVALLLRDWEELSYAEMADVLDIPQGTVKSRVHHARKQLGQILTPMMRGEAEV